MLLKISKSKNGDVQTERERAAREEANRPSMFLGLPSELRNLIYDYYMPDEDEDTFPCVWKYLFRYGGPVLWTCRQLRRETLPLLFRPNTLYCQMQGGRLTPGDHLPECFPDEAFACLRKTYISASFICAHTYWKRFQTVRIDIDRERGLRSVTDESSIFCFGEMGTQYCRRRARESEEVLTRLIWSAGLLDKDHRLTKKDLQDMAMKFEKASSSFEWLNSVDRYRSMVNIVKTKCGWYGGRHPSGHLRHRTIIAPVQIANHTQGLREINGLAERVASVSE